VECESCLWVRASELKKYRLDLMAVQIRWDKGVREAMNQQLLMRENFPYTKEFY